MQVVGKIEECVLFSTRALGSQAVCWVVSRQQLMVVIVRQILSTSLLQKRIVEVFSILYLCPGADLVWHSFFSLPGRNDLLFADLAKAKFSSVLCIGRSWAGLSRHLGSRFSLVPLEILYYFAMNKYVICTCYMYMLLLYNKQ